MIPAFVPALSLAGFVLRSSMSLVDVTIVEDDQAGFTARSCLATQSRIYAQLRKRYAVDSLGQVMGPPSASGLAPPVVSFIGVPSRGDLELVLSITTGGLTGTAVFSWQDNSTQPQNGSVTPTAGVVTGSAVVLTATGVIAVFPPAPSSFNAGTVYTAATPVPEVILRWVTDITTPRVYERRGSNPANDSMLAKMLEREATALKEIREAADAKDGLFDLPLNVDVGGSGISAPTVRLCSQASPFSWMDTQRERGRREDARSFR